jgi:hypothetical protein
MNHLSAINGSLTRLLQRLRRSGEIIDYKLDTGTDALEVTIYLPSGEEVCWRFDIRKLADSGYPSPRLSAAAYERLLELDIRESRAA